MEKFESYFSKLTPAEKAYFIGCTDMFHDTPYSVDGRPSMSKQLQNTVVFNLERNVSQQDFTGVTPGSNWDLNLVSLPWITDVTFQGSADFGTSVDQQAGPTALIGGVSMFGVDSGLPTIDPANLKTPVRITADELLYPPTGNTTRNFYEILCMGYEVYNTTPDLYLGGSLVRYRVPTQARKANLFTISSATTWFGPVNANVIPPLPATESLATQYPDSVIDSAKSGTYQQHCIQDSVSDFKVAENACIHIAPADVAPTVGFTPNAITSLTSFGTLGPRPTLLGDFDIVGTYFAGLPPQTTLKVRVRYIISMVPSSNSASLVSLAKMSPPENPKLTQLVSLVQNKLPPGVPVTQNPGGEWWKAVVKIAGNVAPIIGAEFGPMGKKVGQIVQTVAQEVAKPKAKKKGNVVAKASPAPKAKGK